MKQKHSNTTYELPLVLVGAFKAEQGFAQSFNSQGLQDISGDYVKDDSGSWN